MSTSLSRIAVHVNGKEYRRNADVTALASGGGFVFGQDQDYNALSGFEAKDAYRLESIN